MDGFIFNCWLFTLRAKHCRLTGTINVRIKYSNSRPFMRQSKRQIHRHGGFPHAAFAAHHGNDLLDLGELIELGHFGGSPAQDSAAFFLCHRAELDCHSGHSRQGQEDRAGFIGHLVAQWARRHGQGQRERAREVLSREVGYIRKPHAGRLRVALAFPNTYFVGMSNLGFQTVYRLFNEQDEAVCERVFLPPKQELAVALRSGVRLITLESQTAVADVDVLAFSVSFEWDYTNVLTMLRLAGLPIRAEDRDDRHPLVVLGGATSFLNPEPLAPFVDLVCAGEGEVLVPPLVDAASAGGGHAAIQARLAGQPGMYVPALVDVRYDREGRVDGFDPVAGSSARAPVMKAAVRTVDMADPPATTVFSPDTEFGSRFLVEVVRGCANLCRFCWAGYNYLPVRAFDADRILRLAEAARPHATRVGLVSIALCAHPEIERMLNTESGLLGLAGRADMRDLLRAAAEGIQQRGKAARGDKTLLDSLWPAIEALERARASGQNLAEALAEAAVAAEAGAEATRPLRSKFGRAAWMQDRTIGVKDAGASVVVVVLRSLAAYVRGEG